MTATMRYSNNETRRAHRADPPYRFTDEVDLERFLPVYDALRRYLDEDPARRSFQYSVYVFQDLRRDGWTVDEARSYAQAARLVCEEGIDPRTGQPLAGLDAVHPVYVQAALDEVGLILEDVPGGDAEELAGRIVARMVDLGWQPGN